MHVNNNSFTGPLIIGTFEKQAPGSRERGKWIAKSCTKTARKLGRDSSGACEHCFQYLIPVYQLPVYPMIGQSLWQFSLTPTSIIWLRALSLKHTSSMWSPPTPRLLTLWHLDILTQETVFVEVGGLRYLKRFLQALPCCYCSLIRYFTALSLFSLVCRLRAWHSLGKRERSKQERRHRDYAGLLQLFFTLLLIGLTQVACFSKSQYTLTASLLHPSFGSIVYSPMIIKRDYPLWKRMIIKRDYTLCKQPWKHAFLK